MSDEDKAWYMLQHNGKPPTLHLYNRMVGRNGKLDEPWHLEYLLTDKPEDETIWSKENYEKRI